MARVDGEWFARNERRHSRSGLRATPLLEYSTGVIPGCAHLAQAWNPYSRWWLWIPGSRFARPGMTVYLTVGPPGGSACARGVPRMRDSNSAVGQESAGRPYLICIAFTALRLC